MQQQRPPPQRNINDGLTFDITAIDHESGSNKSGRRVINSDPSNFLHSQHENQAADFAFEYTHLIVKD